MIPGREGSTLSKFRFIPAAGVLFLSAAGCFPGWGISGVVPGAQESVAVRKFDFGAQSSPLWPGFVRVNGGTEYGGGRQFGWRWTEKLSEGLTNKPFVFPDPLAADWIEATGMFSVDVPEGKYDAIRRIAEACPIHGTLTNPPDVDMEIMSG